MCGKQKEVLLVRKWWWPHIIVWALIIFVASWITPGADPFLPLIPIALGIAVYEVGRRWIAREIGRRSSERMRQLPR
jgi:hypothetical protein